MKIRKIRKIILALAMAMAMPVSGLMALTVTVDFGDATLNTALKSTIETQLNSDLAKYDTMPDFTRGMANSAVYASNAGTTRGYQGYDLFNISVGTMFSLQMPNAEMNADALTDDLQNKGDVYAGVGWQPVAGQIGINMGFLVEDLYLTFKFGKFSTEWVDYELGLGDDKVNYDASIFGFMLNYSIVKEKSILARSILWRGITVGTGFTYASSKIGYGLKLDTMTLSNGGYDADVDPSIELEVESKNYIIPVEIYTSMRLLYIVNAGVGAGFDFVVGSNTDLNVSADGDATITTAGIYQGTKGTITVSDASTSEKADRFRPRLMANVGVSLGPVYIDAPVTYYFDNAYSVGITAGIVW